MYGNSAFALELRTFWFAAHNLTFRFFLYNNGAPRQMFVEDEKQDLFILLDRGNTTRKRVPRQVKSLYLALSRSLSFSLSLSLSRSLSCKPVCTARTHL